MFREIGSNVSESSSLQKMEAASQSRTLIPTHQTARHHISEDNFLHSHRHETVKSLPNLLLRLNLVNEWPFRVYRRPKHETFPSHMDLASRSTIKIISHVHFTVGSRKCKHWCTVSLLLALL